MYPLLSPIIYNGRFVEDIEIEDKKFEFHVMKKGKPVFGFKEESALSDVQTKKMI